MRWPIENEFPTLGARAVCAFRAFFPDGRPQGPMDRFLRSLLERGQGDPSLLGLPAQPDECFENGFALNNTEPEKNRRILKMEARVLDFLALLNRIGLDGEPMGDALWIPKEAWGVSARKLGILAPFGLSAEVNGEGALIHAPGLAEDWKMRAMERGPHAWSNPAVYFLYGMREGYAPATAVESFGKFFEGTPLLGALGELEGFFASLGYRLDNNPRERSVRWHKAFPDKAHGHFAMSYRMRDRNPFRCEFVVPGFRKLLGRFDQFDPAVQRLCFTRTKDCDNCRYCVQTDKTGKRPIFALKLSFGGETRLKCPLYPFFSWHEPDAESVKALQTLYLAAEAMQKEDAR